jgi:hypothetical protein
MKVFYKKTLFFIKLLVNQHNTDSEFEEVPGCFEKMSLFLTTIFAEGIHFEKNQSDLNLFSSGFRVVLKKATQQKSGAPQLD